MLTPLLMLLVSVLVIVAVMSILSVRAHDRDVAWLAGVPVPSGSEAGAVYRRYLERHRGYRLAGGWFGVALAMVVGITWDQQVHAGIGQGSPFGDVLFCGVAGVVVGALAAESYRLAQPRAALASLAPRPDLGSRGLLTTARTMVGVAVAVGALSLGAHDATSLLVAVAGAAVVGLAELTRRAIAGRRRPVMSDAAAEVDRRIRWYAASAVAHLELSAGALTLGWAIAKVPGDQAGFLRAASTLVLLVLAVVELHRARPRPPRSFVGAVPVVVPRCDGP